MSNLVARPDLRSDDLASWRIWLLRAGYLLLTIGMGSQIIPVFFDHKPSNIDEGVVNSMLLAMVVLCALGLRYPLKMLPILFWEMIWKTAWLLSVALPMALGDGLDEATASVAFACSLVVIVYAVVPWDYVWRTYMIARRQV